MNPNKEEVGKRFGLLEENRERKKETGRGDKRKQWSGEEKEKKKQISVMHMDLCAATEMSEGK